MNAAPAASSSEDLASGSAPPGREDACEGLAEHDAPGEHDAALGDEPRESPPAVLAPWFLPPPPPPIAPPPSEHRIAAGPEVVAEQPGLAGFSGAQAGPSAFLATEADASSSPAGPFVIAGDDVGEQSAASFASGSNASPAVFSPPRSPVSRTSALSSSVSDKMTREVSESQVVVDSYKSNGMEKAERVPIMNRDFAAEPSVAASSGVVPAEAKAVTPILSATEPAAPAPELAVRASGPRADAEPTAVAALRLIERVEQAADRLSALRSREEFRFSVDFAGRHRVDVKVAVRDGRVFADFRADTAELRDALARGWDAFVRSREGGAQRWAEPVFSSHAASPVERSFGGPADESALARDFSANEHPSSRRERPDVDDAPTFSGAPVVAARSSAPLLAAASEAAPRSDAARLLSVLA